jgi:hypothetical protein
MQRVGRAVFMETTGSSAMPNTGVREVGELTCSSELPPSMAAIWP